MSNLTTLKELAQRRYNAIQAGDANGKRSGGPKLKPAVKGGYDPDTYVVGVKISDKLKVLRAKLNEANQRKNLQPVVQVKPATQPIVQVIVTQKPAVKKTAKRSDRPPAPKLDASDIIYPEILRALSIGGCFGYHIINGEQTVESRVWPTNFRGQVLIHVSSSSEWGTPKEEGIDPARCPKMSILGLATVTGCVWNDKYQLWEHVISNPIPLDCPILNVPGAYNYWRPSKPAQKAGFNAAWKQLQDMGKV
ncbi:MAG TPA: hypothetical protein V6C84_30180 [Coleofasciculaceae cyanobacterium]|jgi:hypothetical protein